MRGTHHAFLFAAALCAACSTPRPPDLRHAVETSWGVVRAARRDDAVEIAQAVERIAPRVAAAIPKCSSAPLDIRLVEELERAHWGGATITTAAGRWIELPESGRDASAQAILAHEIVHYWLADEWLALPPVLEEGFAIHVAHLAVPEAAPRERGELALVLGTLIDGSVSFLGPTVERDERGPRLTRGTTRYTLHARIDADELPVLSTVFALESDELAKVEAPGVRAVLDALAYVVVDRIGIDKLRDLCRQAGELGHARVPGDWIFGAARIDPDEPVSLARAVREMLQGPEIRALLLRDDLRLDGDVVDEDSP